ncbi:MAG: ComEC/Rec2 family competence protein [Bacteroidota bacterium]
MQLAFAFWIYAGAFSFFIFLLSYGKSFSRLDSYRAVSGIGALFFLISAGAVNLYLHTPENNPGFFKPGEGEKISAWTGIADRQPENYKTYTRCVFKLNRVLKNNKWISTNGNVLVYTPSGNQIKDSSVSNPALKTYIPSKAGQYEYGTEILFFGTPKAFSRPLNPYEFDKKAHYTKQGISYTFNAQAGQFKLLGSKPANIIKENAYRLAGECNNLLKQALSGNEYGAAAALLLGVRDGLSPEIKKNYSDAGAMHVLAVSGMHVAVLFSIVFFAFGKVSGHTGRKVIYGLCLISAVWFYAFFTGGSPSVLRAALMFSIVIIADITGREQNTLNTLSATAFILLCLDPSVLFDAGAQLSFLAVAGIVTLMPFTDSFLESKAWIPKLFYTSLFCSLFATLFTFPLSLYYFHQFPNLFWLSNLFIVPASNLSLCLGMLFLLLHAVPVMGTFLALLLKWSILLSNWLCTAFAALPYSVTNNLWLTRLECIAVFAAVAALVGLYKYKKFNYIWFCLMACGLLAFSRLNHEIENADISEIWVYNIPGKSEIRLNSAGKSASLLPAYISEMQNIIHRKQSGWSVPMQVQNHLVASGMVDCAKPDPNIESLVKHSPDSLYSIVVWQNKTTILLHKWIPKNYKASKPIKADYLIVMNNSVYNPEWLREKFSFDTLITDGSNSPNRAAKIEEFCRVQNLNYINTQVQGAFCIKP